MDTLDVFVYSWELCLITFVIWSTAPHSGLAWDTVPLSQLLQHLRPPHCLMLQGGQHIYIKVETLCACDHQHCLSVDQL